MNNIFNFNQFVINESSQLAKFLPNNIVNKIYKDFPFLTHEDEFEEVSKEEYVNNYRVPRSSIDYFAVTPEGETTYGKIDRNVVDREGTRFFKFNIEDDRYVKQFKKTGNKGVDPDKVIDYISSRWDSRFSKLFNKRIELSNDIDKDEIFNEILELASKFFSNKDRLDQVEDLMSDELESDTYFNIEDFLYYSIQGFDRHLYKNKSFDEYCHGFLVYLLDNIEIEYSEYMSGF
jgi:hypothetical protein